MIKKVIALCILCLPVAAWAIYKPMRVLAPEWNGVSCVDENICVDDVKSVHKARLLYFNAIARIESTLGAFDSMPRVIFCTTESCYESFGFHAPAKATTVGKSGIVISPRGWNVTKISHEFIHYLQSTKLGVVKSLMMPEWFIAGMAYSLSGDTMQGVPERYLDCKRKFEGWFSKVGRNKVWHEAKQL